MNKMVFFVFSLFLSLNGFSIHTQNIVSSPAQDAKILKALKNLKTEYYQCRPFAGFNLITEIQFLRAEHELEAETFFTHRWTENEKKLAGFVKITGSEGAGFASKEGFIAVSVGTLATHLYYVENGKIISRAFPFGTKSDARNQSSIDLITPMLELIKSKKRPSVYFNSLSYAKIPGYESAGTSYIELHEDIELDTSGERGYVGRMGNLLSRLIRQHDIKGAFIHQAPKELKFAYNWSTTLIKNLPQLSEGNNIIGDFSNSSFSAKRVIDEQVEERNIVKDDNYCDASDILSHYVTTPERGIHPKLKIYLDRMIADVENDIDKNPRQFGKQKNIHFVIGITGHLSKLFHDCKDRVGDSEEKSGALETVPEVVIHSPALRVPAILTPIPMVPVASSILSTTSVSTTALVSTTAKVLTPTLALKASQVLPSSPVSTLSISTAFVVDIIAAKFKDWLLETYKNNNYGIQEAFGLKKDFDLVIHHDGQSGSQSFELQSAKPKKTAGSQTPESQPAQLKKAANNSKGLMQVFR